MKTGLKISLSMSDQLNAPIKDSKREETPEEPEKSDKEKHEDIIQQLRKDCKRLIRNNTVEDCSQFSGRY